MSGTIAQKPDKIHGKNEEKPSIDLKSAYDAFISAYARKIEQQAKEQEDVNQNI